MQIRLMSSFITRHFDDIPSFTTGLSEWNRLQDSTATTHYEYAMFVKTRMINQINLRVCQFPLHSTYASILPRAVCIHLIFS